MGGMWLGYGAISVWGIQDNSPATQTKYEALKLYYTSGNACVDIVNVSSTVNALNNNNALAWLWVSDTGNTTIAGSTSVGGTLIVKDSST